MTTASFQDCNNTGPQQAIGDEEISAPCETPNDDPHDGRCRGYLKLAQLSGSHPDLAIFRRFGFLTMMNLMSLQAELVEIEKDIFATYELYDNEIKTSPSEDESEKEYFSESFHTVRNHKRFREPAKLLERSRHVLREYHTLLLQAAEVANLKGPASNNLKSLRQWLAMKEGGDNFLLALERDSIWEQSVEYDLVTLINEQAERDPLARWFSPKFVDAYHWSYHAIFIKLCPQSVCRYSSRLCENVFQRQRYPEKDKKLGIIDYKHSWGLWFTSKFLVILCTVAASLFPVIAIFVLFHVPDTLKRIRITIGMTAILGLVLMVCTNAKMKEVFATTAAFAAVEVVFIGTANGPSTNGTIT